MQARAEFLRAFEDRAVDKTGDTVDFLLTAKRDKAAAQRYLERAINLHGLPQWATHVHSRSVL